jgi:signal transduction histidine kinase
MAKIKTKARALDMLGRQQIAGIPTALSELFKNAHDAYADNVEVDYIRSKNLLILRDDGLGMTEEEFSERWLTIGTDSKLDDEDSINQPSVDASKDPRPIMGEKGIGRLSIAAIGPLVLVLTRARREDGLKPMVASLVNWSLFSLPRLDLEDIDIPTITIEQGSYISEKQFASLINDAKENVKSLSGKISATKVKAICNQIDNFDFDPDYWNSALKDLDSSIDKNLKAHEYPYELPSRKLYLDGDGSGTHFIISSVDDVLIDDIEQSEIKAELSTRLEKALLGFTNTMITNDKPPIFARFRDHLITGECEERISESTFFTPTEFKVADHTFQGKFNEFGQFCGDITVFGESKKNHVVPWTGGNNKRISCGAFSINLAYVHGALRDTQIPSAIWRDLAKKTDRIGGLYIYRDNIRVLPYGDTSTDFVGIETRRSKSASMYFFAYRRMFGAIELSRELNSDLQEKAGREGFIENKAYKQFKSILSNFFMQLAADFFNETGDLSAEFVEKKKRHQENYLLLQKRSNLKSNKKKSFQASLNVFFNDVDNDFWKVEIDDTERSIQKKFLTFSPTEHSVDDFTYKIQRELESKVTVLQKRLSVNMPAGIGFGKLITDSWDKYQISKNDITANITEFKENIERQLIEFEERYGDVTGIRRRFNDSLSAQAGYYQKELSIKYAKAQAAINELQKWAKEEIKVNKRLANDQLAHVKAEFTSINLNNKSNDELIELKSALEKQISEASTKIIEKVELLAEQVSTAQDGSNENSISSSNLTAILESEYEHIKEINEQNSEMVQLGMAIGVIHHEFNGNVKGIRKALRDMQPWAAENEELQEIYTRIRVGFDHLDGYLKTFDPLTRRLARKRVNITGQALSEFISDVFSERLQKNDISIQFTNEFVNQSLFGFTSTIYPAFVNLIDNSIYWLTKSTDVKVITLDADNDGFIIKDTGVGIPTIDQENVFQFSFSRKVGGRGMGLYVTRQTLEDDGFSIELAPYLPDEGANFKVSTVNTIKDME